MSANNPIDIHKLRLLRAKSNAVDTDEHLKKLLGDDYLDVINELIRQGLVRRVNSPFVQYDMLDLWKDDNSDKDKENEW